MNGAFAIKAKDLLTREQIQEVMRIVGASLLVAYEEVEASVVTPNLEQIQATIGAPIPPHAVAQAFMVAAMMDIIHRSEQLGITARESEQEAEKWVSERGGSLINTQDLSKMD